jgi:hypothetical protein
VRRSRSTGTAAHGHCDSQRTAAAGQQGQEMRVCVCMRGVRLAVGAAATVYSPDVVM